MFQQLKWRNVSLGRKYLVIFSIMAITFLLSILVTFLFLNKTSSTMDETVVKNEVAIYSGDLVTLFHEKYILIPEYILLGDDAILNEYLDFSKEFVVIAKQLKNHLSEGQLDVFERMIENNHELDQYFFSIVVPNVQQINTNEFHDLQKSVNTLKNETSQLGQELKMSATTFNQEAINSSQNQLKMIILVLLISSLSSLIISALLLFVINNRIRKNLKKIVTRSKEIANGQLNNADLDYLGNDEIGQLSKSINHMGASLREMISEVSKLSNDVDQHSGMLLTTSEEVLSGSEQVSITIEEMANGASSQADSAAQISETTKDFTEDIVNANVHSGQLVEFSKQVLDVSIKGDRDMKQSLSQMNRVNQVVEASVNKVKNLEKKTQSITEIVYVIKSIAEQTNLLALNASIEAARVGEAGKGFAVVATEVRKLAEEVTRSVENITGIVCSIKEETSIIAEELNLGYEEVNRGTELIVQSGRQFTGIKDSVGEMSEKIQDISTTFKKVEQSSHEINELVENIAAVSEESAAGSEEISASVHEQNHSVEKIASSANQLTTMVEQMNSIIKKFQL